MFIEVARQPRPIVAASLKLDDALLRKALLYAGPFPQAEGRWRLAGVLDGTPWAGWYPVKRIPKGKRNRRDGWTPGRAQRAEAREELEKRRVAALVQGQRALSARKPTWREDAAALETKRFPKVYADDIGVVTKTFKSEKLWDDDGFWFLPAAELAAAIAADQKRRTPAEPPASAPPPAETPTPQIAPMPSGK
jgi:hypothetical protein